MEELKTLKDFRRPKDEEVPYTGEWAMGVNETCDSLKQEAIKWVKKDMEDSTFEPSEIIKKPWTDYGSIKMPNGKYCKCEPEYICVYHGAGKRVTEMNNITEAELK